jgi:hypothetical protein
MAAYSGVSTGRALGIGCKYHLDTESVGRRARGLTVAEPGRWARIGVCWSAPFTSPFAMPQRERPRSPEEGARPCAEGTSRRANQLPVAKEHKPLTEHRVPDGAGARTLLVEDARRPPFSWVANSELALIRELVPSRLQAGARSVYLAMVEACSLQCDGQHKSGHTRKRLAELSGLSERRVFDLLAQLAKVELVESNQESVNGRPLPTRYVVVDSRAAAARYDKQVSEISRPTCAGQTEEKKEELGENPQTPLVEQDSTEATTGRQLFEFWQQECGHPQARFTRDRQAKIRARLREGYTAHDIAKAIRGAARKPTVGDDGRVYDDLELICRSGTKVEDFMARADLPAVARPVNGTGTRRTNGAVDIAALQALKGRG